MTKPTDPTTQHKSSLTALLKEREDNRQTRLKVEREISDIRNDLVCLRAARLADDHIQMVIPLRALALAVAKRAELAKRKRQIDSRIQRTRDAMRQHAKKNRFWGI